MTMEEVLDLENETADKREIDVKGGMVTDAPATGYEDLGGAMPRSKNEKTPVSETPWYRGVGLAAAAGLVAGYLLNAFVERARN
jgi:hypothetical protein